MLIVENEVANSGSSDEPCEGEYVWNSVYILMRSELFECLEQRLFRGWWCILGPIGSQ